jgi:hypothetical protein
VAEGCDESSRRGVRDYEGESIEIPTLSQTARKDGPPAEQRPHSSLKHLPPAEFARTLVEMRA